MDAIRKSAAAVSDELMAVIQFVRETKIEDSIGAMETNLSISIGLSARIGELLNEAEYNYSMQRADAIEKLSRLEDETETTRKTKLDAWVADEKKIYQDLKNIHIHLKAIRMSLMQAIKTRREEPR